MIKPVGPITDVKILLVGEAPGYHEEKQGEPFVGPSGKMLRQMLSHAGINYKDCFVTNVVLDRPPKNDFGIYYEDKGRKTPKPRLLAWIKNLHNQIDFIQPNVIVTVGGEALRAVTGKRGVEAWRGTPLSYKNIPVIPTYHPAAVLRQYSFHPIVELDLQKALRWSTGRPKTKKWNIILEPTLDQVRRFRNFCRDKTVSFDLESIGTTVRCIGLACEDTAICIPFMRFKSYQPSGSVNNNIVSLGTGSPSASSYWSLNEEQLVVKTLAELFADPSIQKIGQNSISFDQPFLEREFGFEFNNHNFDCMHAFHLLYPELPKGLSFLCSILTDYPNYWTEKDGHEDKSEWTYNCWDCIITLDVYDIIHKDLIESGLDTFYYQTLHPLAEALSKAQSRGVLIDKPYCAKLVKEYEDKRDHAELEVRNYSSTPNLNLNSHPQLKKLLYTDFGFKPQTNKAGSVSTDEECLKKLVLKYPKEPIFQDIMTFRKCNKMLEFLCSKTKADGRMPTSYNASGTTTGRIASSRTLWGEGMNLMNIPKDLRGIFIAQLGCSFVKCDLSQAETRVVAELMKRHGDPILWDRYQDPNFDIHTWLSSEIYGKPEDEITKEERQVGKIGNHSGNYRAGPKVLEKVAIKYDIPGITYNVAQEILQTRGKVLPGLALWWDWIEKELARTRTIWTCLGRRRIFFGRLEHSTYRDATAHEPQSIVGDVNNIIFTKLSQELDNDCWPLLQVHDEVVVECPDKKIQHVIETMRKVGNIELWINKDKPLVIPLDISVGKDWSNCKEI